MIAKFVEQFDKERENIKAELRLAHPDNYEQLVRQVVETIGTGEYEDPDPERITTIDHGEYQGTLLFVIAAKGYQPSTFWWVTVSYGSCSGCDTLQAISSYSSEPPTEEQVDDYFALMLHIVQGIHEMKED